MADKQAAVNDVILKRQALIETIMEALPRSLDASHKEQLTQFIPAYFEYVPNEELAQISADDLAGTALAHWQLARNQGDETHSHAVYNPTFDKHGWQSAHTIIQIVARDQSWLVSSMHANLERLGHTVHRIIHPILSVERTAEGQWLRLTDTAPKESLIHIEIDAITEEDQPTVRQSIDELFKTLAIIRHDSAAVRSQLESIADSVENTEQSEFVRWLDERQFACLGYAQLQLGDGFTALHHSTGVVHGSEQLSGWNTADLMPDGLDGESLDTAFADNAPVVCKAGHASPIIRNEPADLIMYARRDANGKLTHIDCIVGLFITGLQNEAVSSIPWMRERVERVINASGTTTESHDGKAIAATLRGLPRAMLMQTRSNDLLSMASGIVALQERQQVRLFNSTDSLGRFSNCLVYIPRDAYSRDLRLTIEQILITHIDGISAGFDTRFSSESALARLHFIIQKNPPFIRDIDWDSIEQRIRQAAITWTDRLESTLRENHDEVTAMRLLRRYCTAFPSSYREDYSARAAAADVDFIEHSLPEEAPVMSFYRHIVADSGTINFKLFAKYQPVSLSDVIPVIENMGLRVESEHPFEVRGANAPPVWIHEFTVQQTNQNVSQETDDSAIRIQTAFDHIWRGDVENDGFNRLILDASLEWRQVVILRALCKYLLQINVPFSQAYMIDSLIANAPITRLLVELFETRFKPGTDSAQSQQMTALLDNIDAQLDSIVSLDEDRILRAYRNVILATLRTNFYRTDEQGQLRDYLSFKLDSKAVPDLPLPRPMVEVFVYSSKVEGIHLRGGPVARGGLRWSDRREDYRTEVLGLMKAQMVKNAVIVPVGSKGGFYVKAALPPEREAMMAIVIDCYRTFLSGLLDITDNLDGATVIPPPDVVRYDKDDPYLVVAADKGTATFSDYANEVAIKYGFWLGDAFASGGSVGYDHKKMGITARGAWESVKRHFRNLAINTQKDEFTTVGIGDMAGDVFGNGMLLSPHLKLVAAFNHQHIFIDPSPNASLTFAERQRLFNLPRSSWSDYDSSLISAGGGIFSRQAKQIELSPEAQQILGTDQAKLTPTALISVILQAPVDLLWNGGIGTYVKAASQTHADAADRANDSLRINGAQLRAKVVGEGGNLGFTQLGRIEFAQNGGLIYTDAIDNSAGVDCSDHEVNIKILANAIVAGDDMTIKQRDQLLESMTTDVGLHVLRDNYLQTQCIDLCVVDGPAALNEQSRFMQHLESIGRLDRTIEYLPEAEEIADRMAHNRGLVRPEIAVLVSYSKMVMFDDLMGSNFSADPSLESVLMDYFPQALTSGYREQILQHRLRPEIIATIVTNDVVNRLGPTFTLRMRQELNATASDVGAAFVIVKHIFRLPELWASIEELDNQIDAIEQYRMQILVRGLVERATHWLIRTRKTGSNIHALVEQFRSGLDELIEAMPDCLSGVEQATLEQRVNHFVQAGAPTETATAVARVVPLSSAMDIVEIARSLSQPVADVASVYFALGQHLDLSWLRERIGELVVTSHWHKLATAELRGDLHYQQRHLCAEVVGVTDASLPALERVSGWANQHATAISQYQSLMTELKANTSIDFAMLSLAINEVHRLLRSDRPLAVQA
ncbi:NAD-glutamate dehydrogenase [Granulosicoccus antarcticus]|uniref:NAD-specific glutamate dehydrogenase n=1 Tax=Granulosicoccus antarcticus IMCC3135 TaxID=1192854 RepID=A0A2Z2P034_9GAMM|nr:NAD-glutamate dehydrogenase [Granulosicoccus antarcticus]ASJ75581.1 NAD-specific glutamate dehydrogenase [Granulosicoccus antarcticus IMCC3135]